MDSFAHEISPGNGRLGGLTCELSVGRTEFGWRQSVRVGCFAWEHSLWMCRFKASLENFGLIYSVWHLSFGNCPWDFRIGNFDFGTVGMGLSLGCFRLET